MVGGTRRLHAEQFDSVLGAAQEGAAWAVDILYRELAPSVVGYLRLQGAEDPEDLSSEVFLGVFRSLGSFAGGEPEFRSWVFSIAHRRVIDERRRKARRVTGIAAGMTAPDGPRPEDTEGSVLAALEAERIIRLCDRLSPDQRDVVLLRLVGDLSVDQTATALGKQNGAVRALQRRGLAALRKELEREISTKGVSR